MKSFIDNFLDKFRKNNLQKKEIISGYLFILPIVSYFLIFQLIPMIMAFYYSFTKWNMRTPAKWVGLGNYKSLLFDRLQYPNFWHSLEVTFKYILMNMPLALILALILGAILNSKVKFEGIFKTLFFVPNVTSTVAIAAIWTWIYDSKYGLLNIFINKLPVLNEVIGTHAWLHEVGTALPSLAFIGVWAGLGYNILLVLSGLKSIPKSLYEAAKIDGANTWQVFTRITLPMLTPTIFFLVVTGFIGGIQVFNEMYLMTNGGPSDSTLSYILYLYNQSFRYFKMGIASSMSYILFLIILIVTFINFKYLPQSIDDL